MPDYDYKQLRIIEPKDPDQLLIVLSDEDGNEISRMIGDPRNKEFYKVWARLFVKARGLLDLLEDIEKDNRTAEDVKKRIRNELSEV